MSPDGGIADPPSSEPGPSGSDDPAVAVEAELHRKSSRRRIAEAALSVTALVIMFSLVIPRVTGSTYREVGHHLRTLRPVQIATLAGIWAASLGVYGGVLTAVLPGLRRAQGVVLNTTTSAVSNVVPFGGAVGVGATYGMCRSWGFSAPAITLAILVSGVWNVLVKLGLPVVALALLAMAGKASGALVAAAAVGLIVLVTAVAGLAVVMRSDPLAAKVGGLLQRKVDLVGKILRRRSRDGVQEAVVEFRHRSSALIAERWPRITTWMVLYALTQFLLQLTILRWLGESRLSVVDVFAAFAFGRLLSAIPITPSGVGFADTGAAAALVAFGGDPAISTAGVLLFTGFVYLLEIPVGAGAWIVWARRTSWRRSTERAGSGGPGAGA